MPIPALTLDNCLPPFIGDGPGDSSLKMSPYVVSISEIINRFGTTEHRKCILAGWLRHRKALRNLGFTNGFQWIDGSFVERKATEPRDIDVVSFLYRPHEHQTVEAISALFAANPDILLNRTRIKALHHVDFLAIDLSGSTEGVAHVTSYFTQLFSHQRESFVWKGMLSVTLDENEDESELLVQLTDSINGGES